MATSFSTIYDAALSKFKDRDLISMTPSDRERLLRAYLSSAESEFVGICKYDLGRKTTNDDAYLDDLDGESVEILALGVAVAWMRPKLSDSELYRNKMSTKDYSFFSEANLIREMSALYNSLIEDFRARIVRYSYKHADIAKKGV